MFRARFDCVLELVPGELSLACPACGVPCGFLSLPRRCQQLAGLPGEACGPDEAVDRDTERAGEGQRLIQLHLAAAGFDLGNGLLPERGVTKITSARASSRCDSPLSSRRARTFIAKRDAVLP